jgi:DNA-binding transcriptional ArsR family regulator
MVEKYLLFSLEDEKAKKLGEVIANPTSRKIANLLAEKEASETDISKELNIPLNTVEYNLNRLVEAGIVEKSKNFFWSAKGKKIDMFKVANKLIVISPKKTNVYSKLKSVVPVVFFSALFTAFILWYSNLQANTLFASAPSVQTAAEKAVSAAAGAAQTAQATPPAFPFLQWALIAIWLIVVVYVIWTMKKK